MTPEKVLPQSDQQLMLRAIELARLGLGWVEPNPMVGCVITRDQRTVAEGWHQAFGRPHAEIEAMSRARESLAGATMFVTLEPCCHHGKTPPCTDAIITAGIRRVVVAMEDPFAQVSGNGIRRLREAGVAVELGLGEVAARALNAPYLHVLRERRPWVLGKWAMSLDGRIATRTGDSRWISAEGSRRIAHEIRGRMDAIIVGRGTVAADNPLLTARPAGPRIATRVVLASRAHLPADCELLKTAREIPVVVVVSSNASAADCRFLEAAGCEVVVVDGADDESRLRQCLATMAKRNWTNVLVEGGSHLLGTFLAARLFNELHVFIAPKLIGGDQSPGACGGLGVARVVESWSLANLESTPVDGDLYVRGRMTPAH